MKISKTGINLIKEFEDLRLKAYYCPAGILTIGYGTTRSKLIKIVPDLVIDEQMAEKLLEENLSYFEDIVNKLVSVKLTQNQFDSLVSFVYNIGDGNFKSSTLLKLLNNGLYKEAANQFGRWNKAKGKVLKGLTKRRSIESDLFLTENVNESDSVDKNKIGTRSNRKDCKVK